MTRSDWRAVDEKGTRLGRRYPHAQSPETQSGMAGITFDAGGLVALDRMTAGCSRCSRAMEHGIRIIVPATALAQAIRHPARQGGPESGSFGNWPVIASDLEVDPCQPYGLERQDGVATNLRRRPQQISK